MPEVVLRMGWGFYGKLPATGDFIRHGLGAGVIDPWDRWMQAGIAASRDALAARWQGCYMSAPIWRFSLAPGVAGRQGLLGIMMASVDRVGRQFPLMLATPLDMPHAAAHLNSRALFEALEDLALAALDDMPLDVLKTRIADLPEARAPGLMTTTGMLSVIAGDDDIAPAMAAPHLDATTLWSARSEDGMRLMRCETLPRGAQFSALFDLDAPIWQAAA